jgi:hypothetical protein
MPSRPNRGHCCCASCHGAYSEAQKRNLDAKAKKQKQTAKTYGGNPKVPETKLAPWRENVNHAKKKAWLTVGAIAKMQVGVSAWGGAVSAAVATATATRSHWLVM